MHDLSTKLNVMRISPSSFVLAPQEPHISAKERAVNEKHEWRPTKPANADKMKKYAAACAAVRAPVSMTAIVDCIVRQEQLLCTHNQAYREGEQCISRDLTKLLDAVLSSVSAQQPSLLEVRSSSEHGTLTVSISLNAWQVPEVGSFALGDVFNPELIIQVRAPGHMVP